MQTSDSNPQGEVPRPWQPRFSLGGLFLVMLVFSVMAAAGSYFFRFLRGGREFQLSFILFTLAAPALLVVIVSLTLGLLKWLGRRT